MSDGSGGVVLSGVGVVVDGVGLNVGLTVVWGLNFILMFLVLKSATTLTQL